MSRMKLKWKIFAKICEDLAQLSPCGRNKVAAIIFPEDFSGIASLGYNGPARGEKHPDCSLAELGKCGCIHAEANALVNLHVSGEFSMIISRSPCTYCAGLIINSKVIKRVVFLAEYRDPSGTFRLNKNGIPCCHTNEYYASK